MEEGKMIEVGDLVRVVRVIAGSKDMAEAGARCFGEEGVVVRICAKCAALGRGPYVVYFDDDNAPLLHWALEELGVVKKKERVMKWKEVGVANAVMFDGKEIRSTAPAWVFIEVEGG